MGKQKLLTGEGRIETTTNSTGGGRDILEVGLSDLMVRFRAQSAS